ncbi:MAG TPA: DNA-directed RNA polymerase subunit delta [Candidatus Pseudogracilibacillus intestinigallinarum]|uniref:Probable DNA-directed RNA polymerase subunit delta n=1 Tax=Candidatus Pseudogracilibacillus intestinigallinarum TaxID=2838742 RepID=A0A9D1PPU0_9BACI|nr:DNA-directed RNA polymerase subunit delta [Candidatus Pseudogracilibacillus intestinigallinarum]
MALEKYSEEQLLKMSMIELANIVLADEKKEMKFADLFNEVAKLKNFTDAQRQDLLARFYTDLNVDGRFMTLGSNVWGLKRWYPVEQTTEKSLAESRKRDLEEADEDFYDEELDGEVEEEVEDDIYDDIDQLEYDEDKENE